eukprot:235903-Pleurochrysis_carterae.AAC.1
MSCLQSCGKIELRTPAILDSRERGERECKLRHRVDESEQLSTRKLSNYEPETLKRSCRSASEARQSGRGQKKHVLLSHTLMSTNALFLHYQLRHS